MESTFSYILIVVIIILSVTVYNYRKKQTRRYLLSKQRYPEIIIEINIQKHQSKINAILINLTLLKEITLSDIRIELISKKRDFNYYSLLPLIEKSNISGTLEAKSKTEFEISFEKFKTLLMDGEHPFSTFRVVIVSKTKQSFKSHEMGFNKKWVIYRPDSGKYN